MKFSRFTTVKSIIAALAVSILFTFNVLTVTLPKDDDPAVTFSKCWDYPASPNLSAVSAGDGDTVYLVDTDRKLLAVDLSSGALLWSSDLAGDPVSNVLATHGLVIVASQVSAGKAVLRALSRPTGITQWSADLPSATSVLLGTLNGTVVALSSAGLASAFESERGAPSWTKEIGAAVTTPPFFQGRTLIVGTDRKEVLAISIPGGQTTVVTKLAGIPTAVFASDPDNVLLGDDRGNLVLTSLSGKRDWKFRNGARISAVGGYDAEYLVTSHDNFLYKLTEGGNVEWKRRLSARIDKHSTIFDRTLIVSTVGDGNVFVVDLANGKIVNRIETGEETSVQSVAGRTGFAVISPKGLSFYSRNCPGSKKAAPDAVPPREKS
ncbi:MAG TPA: PQQ-binding-like beta-propeller repeat protein [Pyrinomonadaceae bacterium]|nr:PQQ-binding-like beta-propeller repeat protein [Pyrinomonadaceae bacterium]